MHMMHTDEAVEFNVGNNKRPPPFLGELTRGLLQRFRSISRVSYVCLFLSRLSTLFVCMYLHTLISWPAVSFRPRQMPTRASFTLNEQEILNK